jgi:mediator of RNA polymerase II transcription subunit 23
MHKQFIFYRLVCETVMGCERLQYHRQNYWVECFKLILKIIGGVDYKVTFLHV